MKSSFDTLGRRKRVTPVSLGKRLRLTERDLLWLSFLHEHGPLPSSYLLALTGSEWRSDKRATERLTDLFNESDTLHGGAYLTRPPQQFRTIDSRYNELVYDLSPAGQKALKVPSFGAAIQPRPMGHGSTLTWSPVSPPQLNWLPMPGQT